MLVAEAIKALRRLIAPSPRSSRSSLQRVTQRSASHSFRSKLQSRSYSALSIALDTQGQNSDQDHHNIEITTKESNVGKEIFKSRKQSETSLPRRTRALAVSEDREKRWRRKMARAMRRMNSSGLTRWEDLFEKMCALTKPLAKEGFVSAEITMDRDQVMRLYEAINSREHLIPGYKELKIRVDPSDPARSIMTAIGSSEYIRLAGELARRLHNGNLLTEPQSRERARVPVAFPEYSKHWFPSYWTKDSVKSLVRSLVHFRQHPHHKDGAAFYQQIPDLLMHLLHSDHLPVESLSEDAYNLALRYLLHRRKIALAQTLLSSMMSPRPTPSTTTINIALNDCRRRYHLLAFGNHLTLMSNLRLAPDSKTWEHLLLLATTEAQKTKVIKHLANSGYLDLTAKASILPVLIPGFVDAKLGTHQLIERMGQLAGKSWLNFDSIHHLTLHLIEHGNVEGTLQLLQALHERKLYRPLPADLKCVIIASSDFRMPKVAVAALRHASNHWGLPTMNSDTVKALFKMTWQMQLHNLARVVWKYGLIHGFAVTDMIHRVSIPFRNSKDQAESASARTARLRSLAWVIVGEHPLASKLSGPGHGTALFQQIIDEEKALWKSVPQRPFVHMVEEAWQRDMEWMENGLRNKTIAEMISAAIRIRLCPRKAKSPTYPQIQ